MIWAFTGMIRNGSVQGQLRKTRGRFRRSSSFAFEAVEIGTREFQQAGPAVGDEVKLHSFGVGRVFGGTEFVVADAFEGSFALSPELSLEHNDSGAGAFKRAVAKIGAGECGVLGRSGEDLRSGVAGVGVPAAAVHEFDDGAGLGLLLAAFLDGFTFAAAEGEGVLRELGIGGDERV